MKKYSHSRVYGKRVNPLSVSIAVAIALFIYILPTGNPDDLSFMRENISHKAILVEKPKTIEEKIKDNFPRNWKTMIAVAHAESRMNPNAVGYNCYYDKNETTVYTTKVKGSHSTACKKEHRKYAWSVDCGVLQLNTLGKVCPKETIDQHLQRGALLSKVQGLNAWVTYQTKAHERYLASN